MSVLSYNTEFYEIMKQFYILTGIKIVLFDENYNELVCYPTKHSFCNQMRKNPEFNKKCLECDKISFEKCRKSGKLNLYKCHIGLYEATMPLINNGKIIGYVMFGQITDIKNKEALKNELNRTCARYADNITNAQKNIDKIKFRTKKQITAAAKILEALASYVLISEMIKPSRKKLLEKIEIFTEEHLNEEITVNRLVKEFYISRTQLYDILGKELKGGIASFIKSKRLKKAKELLSDTDLSLSDISTQTGFSDYNYFIRSFKKEFGITPKQYRIKKNSE